MYYLEDEDQARQLVELGYRGSGDTLSREEFEAQKKMLRERNVQKVHIHDFSSALAVTQIEAYFDVSILPFPDPWVCALDPNQVHVKRELFSAGKDLSSSPVLQVIFSRESFVNLNIEE
jgi:hypothetical protein